MSRRIVAIVGRPNVGKSTIFNRMIKERKAIVDDRPGVTRDRLYASCQWNSREFLLVDTGGFVPHSDEDIVSQVTQQVLIAIEQADLVLFILDAKVGIQTVDDEIARQLKRYQKKVIVAANKADSEKDISDTAEFFKLGLGQVYPVSAANGRLMGDLLDGIVGLLPPEVDEEVDKESLRIAIVGRPNVGKSSLFNSIVGEKRQIVSDIPGTTRDSIDSPVEIGGQKYTFIDTAGLRKKSQFPDILEYYTRLRSLRAIERSDIVLVLVDASEGATVGDIKIADHADEFGKGLIFVANKWDLVKAVPQEEFVRLLFYEAPMLKYARVVFTSALKGSGVPAIIKVINEVNARCKKYIQTARLNDYIAKAVARRQPPAKAGKLIKFYYMTQTGDSPPKFIIFCNHPKQVDPSYKRFLENQLREDFDFSGTPVVFVFKPRRKE